MIHRLDTATGGWATALQEFERQFWYPLGPRSTFRIEHGDDYTRFFRAMGPAVTFCEERNGEVRGVMSVALRRVHGPDGNLLDAAYFGDLKVRPSARGGPTAARLLQHAAEWALQHTNRAFALVMGGTDSAPSSYTGRLGIPACREIGALQLLRIPARQGGSLALCPADVVPPQTVRQRFDEWTTGTFFPEVGQPELRSQCEPLGLILSDGEACGILEDTRRAKRLFADDGQEIVSAHLSRVAFRSPEDGARLIRAALAECDDRGLPALFVNVAPDRASTDRAAPDRVAALLQELETLGIRPSVVASVGVFGHGFEPNSSWYVDTAEI